MQLQTQPARKPSGSGGARSERLKMLPAQTPVGAGAVEVVDLALDVAAAHEAPYQVSKGFPPYIATLR